MTQSSALRVTMTRDASSAAAPLRQHRQECLCHIDPAEFKLMRLAERRMALLRGRCGTDTLVCAGPRETHAQSRNRRAKARRFRREVYFNVRMCATTALISASVNLPL